MSDIFTSIYGQHGWAVIFGFTHGGYYTVVTLFIKTRTNSEDLAMGLGLFFLSEGLASIVGPTVFGKLIKLIHCNLLNILRSNHRCIQ